MHLRHRNYRSALLIMQHACSGSTNKSSLAGNLRVWQLYIDLLESLSSFKTTKEAYERTIELRIATPQLVLNFCAFLQRNNHFEESFRVYERALNQLFSWPHCYELWITYLEKMIEKYADKKCERIRDLFELAIESAP
mmetsp:Transcript_9295/g.7087  ORF Transcript_9295/g.7087 Transcript_9295/m.7087 type:complete len:138 (-) Transcript_9295:313-726(-)